jgi:hypothetical protein
VRKRRLRNRLGKFGRPQRKRQRSARICLVADLNVHSSTIKSQKSEDTDNDDDIEPKKAVAKRKVGSAVHSPLLFRFFKITRCAFFRLPKRLQMSLMTSRLLLMHPRNAEPPKSEVLLPATMRMGRIRVKRRCLQGKFLLNLPRRYWHYPRSISRG